MSITAYVCPGPDPIVVVGMHLHNGLYLPSKPRHDDLLSHSDHILKWFMIAAAARDFLRAPVRAC